ncbi:MAG: protein-tyrosine-phosphatase [Saprospiraceae bacterium]|nr:protein-tyrosine-phosphatase [Saprospiraceae bacterium]
MIPEIKNYINRFLSEESNISDKRKSLLKEIAKHIENKIKNKQIVNLIFICTHNSRRSHFGQIWAQTASIYYEIPNVNCFSGGTEATEFNPRTVGALKNAGFKIEQIEFTNNPVYSIYFANNRKAIKGFSKKISHENNPQNNFIAIMTCSDADEACPIVSGADARFSLTYEDPKIADNTNDEGNTYNERCKQIAREIFYLFSNINS